MTDGEDLRLLTIPQVAERLGVSRAMVYTRIAAGDLRVVDIGRGQPKSRVRSDDLRAFIDKRTRRAPTR